MGASQRKRRFLYIFDEPTTGLHFDDVSKLLSAFRRLIDAGGSIVVIEHNLEVIKTADWVIDLGPEGGDRGGYVVGAGTPEAIAKLPNSYTGKYLAARPQWQWNVRFQWAQIGSSRRLLGGLLSLLATSLFAQTSSSKTVRHHRVVEQDPSQPPELSQAEAAIEKKDYASAEPLLKKVVVGAARELSGLVRPGLRL